MQFLYPSDVITRIEKSKIEREYKDRFVFVIQNLFDYDRDFRIEFYRDNCSIYFASELKITSMNLASKSYVVKEDEKVNTLFMRYCDRSITVKDDIYIYSDVDFRSIVMDFRDFEKYLEKENMNKNIRNC